MSARSALHFYVPALAVLVSLPSAAATFVVNSGADVEGPPWIGVPERCAAGSTLPCRLRDAVAAARGGDRIVFAPAVTEVALARTLKFTDTSGLPVTVDGGGRVSLLQPLGNPTLRMMGPHTNVVVLRGLTIPGALERPSDEIPSGLDRVDECGGAILNQGDLTLERSTVFSGFAKFGGLICNLGELRISDSTLTGGRTQFSGGAIASSGTLEVTNSTIVSNRVMVGFFGETVPWPGSTPIYRSGAGGVFNRYGSAEFNFVTMALNNGFVESHIQKLGHSILNFCGDLRVRNSVLQQTPGMGLSVGGFPCTANPARIENSLFPVSTEGLEFPLAMYREDGGGNIDAAAPLEPLAANGGPTPTAALPQDSLAIDAVPCVDAPATDQRGRSRPRGAACDMGAFEYTGELFVDGFEPGAELTSGHQP